MSEGGFAHTSDTDDEYRVSSGAESKHFQGFPLVVQVMGSCPFSWEKFVASNLTQSAFWDKE